MPDTAHQTVIFENSFFIRDGPSTRRDRGGQEYKSRRPPNKSRTGCRTCKTRRLKCDEQKPECGQCTYSNRQCTYAAQSNTLRSPVRRPPPIAHLNQLSVDFMDASYPRITETWKQLPRSIKPIELFDHFIHHEPTWIGSVNCQRIFQQDGPRLSVAAPYLRYAILSFSAYHMASAQSGTQKYHVAGAVYYNCSLEAYTAALESIGSEDHDAIFACSLLLSMIAFNNLSASSESDEFPGKNIPVLHIAELRSMHGFHVLQKVPGLQSKIDHSVWRPLILRCGTNALDPPISMAEHFKSRAIMDGLERLCGSDAEAKGVTNAYGGTLNALHRLMLCEVGYEMIGPFFCFTKSLNALSTLLEIKEPRALLLLCYWYAIAIRIDQWWIHNSARSEGLKLLSVLRHHPSPHIQGFLGFPSEQLHSDEF
ncbi:hypothetical protein GQ53DRAFT_466576 [Thozetella sp. PMI_491]|nr:hypothetical protein GQ53DRAFT_466576 [Thozetella sp. PMI_491]